MALGYCTVCDKLGPIRPGEFLRDGSRQRVWYPVAHDAPDGRPCRGDKKGIR